MRACIEQLDIFSCERAEKLRLPPKDKAEVLIYKYSAGPLCSPELPLDKALKLDPQNVLAYFLKAEAILCTGNRDAAIPLYIKAIELNPEWKPYYVDVGLLMNLGCAGCDSIVLKTWQLALESSPDNPRVLAGYGNALLTQKKTSEAQAMFRKALEPTWNQITGVNPYNETVLSCTSCEARITSGLPTDQNLVQFSQGFGRC